MNFINIKNIREEVKRNCKHCFNWYIIRTIEEANQLLNQQFNTDYIIFSPSLRTIWDNNTRLHLKKRIKQKETIDFDLNSKIKHIYACHCNIYKNDKFTTLPLGIGNKKYSRLIQEIKKKKYKKENLVYANFNCSTNDIRKYLYYTLSKTKKFIKYDPIIEKLPKIKVYNRKNNINNSNYVMSNYFENIAKSKFCLCPEGHRIDTFRFWEVASLDSIPIVSDYDLYKNFENDIPLIRIKNYENLTKDFLEQEYEKIQNKKYNKDKLNNDYWVNMITNDIKSLELKS